MSPETEDCIFDGTPMRRGLTPVRIARKSFGSRMGWLCPKCPFVAFSAEMLEKLLRQARRAHIRDETVMDWYEGATAQSKIKLGRRVNTARLDNPRTHIRPSWFKEMDCRLRRDPYLWELKDDRRTGGSWVRFIRNPEYDGPKIGDLDAWRVAHGIPSRKPFIPAAPRPRRAARTGGPRRVTRYGARGA